MIIQQTRQIDLASAYSKTVRHERSESLRLWQGGSRADQANSPPAPVSGSQSPRSEALDNEAAEENELPEITFLRHMIELLSGRKVEAFSARDLDLDDTGRNLPDLNLQQGDPGRANWGAVIETHELHEEHEVSHFSASGSVRTADGREISFQMDLRMESHFRQESSTRLQFGQATKDPLVINFSGSAAQLTDQFFRFDLNGDGNQEDIPQLASGSGYLFFDRNRDGIANDGTELFGPATNNGFTELAALDDDGNGWIDEADSAFAQLGVWRMGASGESEYTSLKAAGIGALALAHLATPNTLRGSTQQLLGEVRSSGVALTEGGRALAMQQIDLVVR